MPNNPTKRGQPEFKKWLASFRKEAKHGHPQFKKWLSVLRKAKRICS